MGHQGAEAEGAKQKCGPDVVVVSIAAEEEMLKSRVGAIGEAEAEGTHNTEEGFARRYEAFTAANSGEAGGPAMLLRDNQCKDIEIQASAELDENMDVVRLSVGPPRNYDPLRAAREVRFV